jgi:hypothetical protein
MHLGFADHASFHRAAAGMVLGSLAAGSIAHAATSGAAIAPLLGGLAGLGLGAGWAYGRRAWRLAAMALAAVPLLTMALQWPALIVSGALAGLGLAVGGSRGAAGGRGAVVWSATAGVLLLAMWCGLRVDTAQETHGWPGWITDGVAAAAIGAVAMLAALPRHLTIEVDPVTAALRRLPASLDHELRQLCDRATCIWAAAAPQLRAADRERALLRDGVVKTLEVAARSAEVRAIGPSDAELTARVADLEQRIAAATDDEVKAQYTAARAGLEDQRRYRARIAQGRERLVARMHNHVAALEKLQLAATGLAGSRASEGAPAVVQLAELSSDVAASGEALAEVELAAPSA